MISAMQHVEARWQAIFEGRVFDHVSGVSRGWRYVRLGLDTKRMPGRQDEDFPFFAQRVIRGQERSGHGEFGLLVVAGVYVSPDTDQDGDIDSNDDPALAAASLVEELVEALCSLSADPSYPPYSLDKLVWQIGDADGSQPGPDHYIVAAELTFAKEPAYSNRLSTI